MKTQPSLKTVPLKNIRARPGRSLFLLLLAVLQAACALVALLLVQGLGYELHRAEQRLGADILVYPAAGFLQLDSSCVNMLANPVPYYRDRSQLSLLAQNDDVEAISYQVHIAAPHEENGVKWIIGYEPESDFVVTAWLNDPWQEEKIQAEGGILIGSDVETDSSDQVDTLGEHLKVAAQLARTGGDYDNAIFLPLHRLDSLLRHAPHQLEGQNTLNPLSDYSVATIKVKDTSKVEPVANWINLYIRKVKAVHSETLLADTAGALGAHSLGIAVLGGVAWLLLLAALGIAQSVMMNERRAELHIWKVVGASEKTVRTLMLTEYLLIHVLGAATGILTAWLLLTQAEGSIRAHTLNPSAMLLPLALAFFASLLVAWMSARFAVKKALRAAQAQMLVAT